MDKVLLITTKKPPDWESWKGLKSRKRRETGRITMTQSTALSILADVVTAMTTEKAVQSLMSKIPSRRHLSYWLGQIGHRGDERLGKGLDFLGYVTAVVESIRNRKPNHQVPLKRKENNEMGKKDQRQKPVMIVRKGKAGHAANEPVKPLEENHVLVDESSSDPTGKAASDCTLIGPEKPSSMGKTTMSTSRAQEYALKSLYVFADCAVQKDENGVFDVLARNFESKAMMNFWLAKIGYADLSKRTQTKDLLDAIRIVARELYRDMRRHLGKPVARW